MTKEENIKDLVERAKGLSKQFKFAHSCLDFLLQTKDLSNLNKEDFFDVVYLLAEVKENIDFLVGLMSLYGADND